VGVYTCLDMHAECTCVHVYILRIYMPSSHVCVYHIYIMMMIAFITFKSSLVPLFEGL